MRKGMCVLVQMLGDDTWYFGVVVNPSRREIRLENGPWAGMVAGPSHYFGWKRTP